MPKLIFNKLVRDGIIKKIENNAEYAFYKELDDKTFEIELNKKFKEELNEVLNCKNKEELKEELADLLEVMLTKASIYGISYDEIEDARKDKFQKRGGYNNKVFLLYTVDKNYVDLNKGCETCSNKDCVILSDEINSGGKYCINYKNPLNK